MNCGDYLCSAILEVQVSRGITASKLTAEDRRRSSAFKEFMISSRLRIDGLRACGFIQLLQQGSLSMVVCLAPGL
jgi:hypothetical protein